MLWSVDGWPVSHDCTAGWSVHLIQVTCFFFKLSADHLNLFIDRRYKISHYQRNCVLGFDHTARFLFGSVNTTSNRPIQRTQCCTKIKSPGVKTLCVLYLHYDVAFTFLNEMEIPETKRFIPKGFELGTILRQPNRFMTLHAVFL